MPNFTAFPNRLYEPNIQHVSQSVLVDTNDESVELTIATPGAILDEPESTTIHLAVQVSDTEFGEYNQVFGALLTGFGGRTPGKPQNPYIRGQIQEHRGKWARAVMTITNVGDEHLRIRVNGRTYA
jgi:hypothetical protein